MIQAGFTFEHPTTKTRTVALESDAETNGMGWLLVFFYWAWFFSKNCSLIMPVFVSKFPYPLYPVSVVKNLS